MTNDTKLKAYYLGKPYPIYIKLDESVLKSKIEFCGKNFELLINDSLEIDKTDINKLLQEFYKRRANKVIKERIKKYQPEFKVKVKEVRIVERQSEWGSCSSDFKLTFHWKLLVYPIDTIDYVVIHEMCHLQHLNHGRSFWRLVGKIQPDYKVHIERLGSKKVN